jgi:YD repeat-containing protein
MIRRRTQAPGELTQRNFPTVSSANIRTTYSYDSAGRLQYETVTKETGSTTNMYKTGYSYSYLSYGRQVVRTEQQYAVNNWQDSNRVTYKWNTLGWQTYEEREDYNFGSWANRYDITQEYDKVGNRTRFHRNVTTGYTSSYGKAMDLSYTYDVRNNLSAISDADDANYAAAVTPDANMNLTVLDESYDNGGGNINHLYTYFDVDDLNRVTAHRTKKYISLARKWQWTKRQHGYDAPGRLVKTTMKQWYDGDTEPAGDSLEHIYDRSRMLQNYDGSSSYGDQWRWAGSQNAHNSPLHSPNADTASQTGYNIANDKTPQRRSFLSPTSEGDQRNLYGQGKPQAKDSTGGGANWYVGVISQPQTAQMANVESRLFFEGTVTATDMDRATDTREKGRIGITGSAQAYGGSNGRVTSEAIGRDINPLGRGGGAALVGGMMNVGMLAPRVPGNRGEMNQGNSVNNACANCPDVNRPNPNDPPPEFEENKEGECDCGNTCKNADPYEGMIKNPCCGKKAPEELGGYCDCIGLISSEPPGKPDSREILPWNWCGGVVGSSPPPSKPKCPCTMASLRNYYLGYRDGLIASLLSLAIGVAGCASLVALLLLAAVAPPSVAISWGAIILAVIACLGGIGIFIFWERQSCTASMPAICSDFNGNTIFPTQAEQCACVIWCVPVICRSSSTGSGSGGSGSGGSGGAWEW